MMISKNALVFLFVWMVSVVLIQATEIVPDEIVQAQIDATAIRLRSGVTQDEGLAIIGQLEQAYTNKTFLVQQVVLYLRFNANTEDRGYGAVVILNKLNMDKATKIKAILPHLNASDAELRNIAMHVLRSTDKAKARTERVDFAAYEQVLRENPMKQTIALIGYMFDRDPQAAVLTVSRVYSPDVSETEITAKAKSGVKESVDYFAARPEWWAHLYVAAMIEKEPYLRTPELVKKLEQDDNPLVREKVSKLKDKLQPK
jgi:hypothetical protein